MIAVVMPSAPIRKEIVWIRVNLLCEYRQVQRQVNIIPVDVRVQTVVGGRYNCARTSTKALHAANMPLTTNPLQFLARSAITRSFFQRVTPICSAACTKNLANTVSTGWSWLQLLREQAASIRGTERRTRVLARSWFVQRGGRGGAARRLGGEGRRVGEGRRRGGERVVGLRACKAPVLQNAQSPNPPESYSRVLRVFYFLSNMAPLSILKQSSLNTKLLDLFPNLPYFVSFQSTISSHQLLSTCCPSINESVFNTLYHHILYNNIMSLELLKKANIHSVRQVLASMQITPLSSLQQLPKNYVLVQQPGKQTATAQFSFSDFKQAFCRFTLLANTCAQLNYYPEIFNVYNRIQVRLYSTDEANKAKVLTVKDLYISYLVNELNSSTVDQAHGQTLEKIKALI